MDIKLQKEDSRPQRREGHTPNGGSYSIMYSRESEDGLSEIVEFDDMDRPIHRTYFKA